MYRKTQNKKLTKQHKYIDTQKHKNPSTHTERDIYIYILVLIIYEYKYINREKVQETIQK